MLRIADTWTPFLQNKGLIIEWSLPNLTMNLSQFFLTVQIWSSKLTEHLKSCHIIASRTLLYRGGVAQWSHLRLTSCRTGFEYQAHTIYA